MPIVTILLLGAINLGLALRSQAALTQVAQQAAQYLIHHPVVYPTACGTQTLTQCTAAEVSAYLAAYGYSGSTVTVTFSQTSTLSQSLLASIQVAYPFPVVMPLADSLNVGPLHNGTITLSAGANTIMATPAPTNLAVTTLSDNTGFHLTWNAPANPAGIPLSYKVYWYGNPITANTPSTSPSFDPNAGTWSYDDHCVVNQPKPACSLGTPPIYAYGVTAEQNNGLESPAITAVSGS